MSYKNNNGFTLVELLVTIAVLGIITGMSFPVLSHFIQNNKNSKYEHYSNILENRAKAYVDSYEEDLFGHDSGGCKYITISMLNNKKMFVDIDDKNMTCKSENTFIKVSKKYNKIVYRVYLGCGSKNNTVFYGYLPTNKISVIYPDRSTPYSTSDECIYEND